MKKLFSFFILVICLALAFSVAIASGVPGTGWWSAETVQNIGSSQITVQAVAYEKDTSTTYSSSKLIDPGKNYTFTPNDFSGMASGFQGSAVLSADGPIKAIGNVTNRPSGDLGISGGQASGQYQGIDASYVANTVYFPVTKGDYYQNTTSYYVQNAGTIAATMTFTFTMKDNSVYNYTTPSAIDPNKMIVVSVFDAPGYSPTNNDQRLGSAVVSSSQPLAGVVFEHKTSENPAKFTQAVRGFTTNDFDTKAYAPAVKNNWYGRFSGIQVQNVSTIPITITVTYRGNSGCTGTYTDTQTNIQPNKSGTFVLWSGSTNFPNSCVGSAEIQTTTPGGQFVAAINEQDYTPQPTGQRAARYFAIPNHLATTKLVAPTFKDNWYDMVTGFNIQNVGTTTATNVVATFECKGAATFTAISIPQTIQQYKAKLFLQPHNTPGDFTLSNPFSSSGVYCAVTVTSDQPIVGYANNEVSPSSPSWHEDNYNYEAFNLTP